MPAKRRKILFYCQSLVGLGHLTSSLLVIRELSAYADVDLIHGGQGLQQMPELPGFRHLRLPTILIDSACDELYAPDSDAPIESIWAERAAAIEQFVSWPYDAVIVEFFPFGRRRLKKEILGLFATVRQRCGAIPIFCFVREILVPAPLDAERRMVKLVREHIHTVFVRGDPNIVRFEETFSLTADIVERLVYVGYVSPPPPASWPIRQNRILVSQGGGEIGKSLLRATIRTAPLLPEYQFLVITSSRVSATEIAELQALVSSPNVRVVTFLHDFQENLQSAALSISLGGDNTLMDVISTRTPALAYPYAGNSEQGLRIEKLAAKGFVRPLTEMDLAPERLSIKIMETINQTYPRQAIAINGAAEIGRRIRAILDCGFCKD
ncbi:glycosyl transferase [Methylomonas sp. EFPC1]|uniref:glycosyltransferase family protein n=1 Tax=Methylomonas sp. EFPC1 TaxID=2812647 RepID=UPI001968939F|nr:glycosyltransferase [Methylomonas sp. EFPC1]QSB03137.1 glycosyl transferase [Methylomonas sp. EFPC1]